MDSRSDEYETHTSSAAAAAAAVLTGGAAGGGESTDILTSLFMNSNLIHKFILKFTWNWTTIAFLVMRPETFAFITAILLIFCLSHTFDFWSNVLAQRLPRHAWIRFFASSTSSSQSGDVADRVALFTSGLHETYHLKQPNVGVYAIRGRRGKMEDMFDYVNEIDRLGVELFGVFDGHGSDKASIYTQKHLLPGIVSRISNAVQRKAGSAAVNNNPASSAGHAAAVCIKSSPLHKPLDTCDSREAKSEFTSFLESNRILSNEITRIVSEEILSLDQRLLTMGRRDMEFGGTTAIIALRLHSLNRLLVANVGDSRGVLCNSRGMAVPISHDHKPQNPGEHRRIKAAGGFIKFNGVWRVAGVLATSRALGDSILKDKKFITAEPDILTFDLSDHQPQFMILASDGLWDIFSNEEAVKFVKDFLTQLRKRGKTDNLPYEAAKSLTLEAYKRLSLDNITILIVLFDVKEFHSVSTSFGIYSSQKHRQNNSPSTTSASM